MSFKSLCPKLFASIHRFIRQWIFRVLHHSLERCTLHFDLVPVLDPRNVKLERFTLQGKLSDGELGLVVADGRATRRQRGQELGNAAHVVAVPVSDQNVAQRRGFVTQDLLDPRDVLRLLVLACVDQQPSGTV